MEPGRNGTWIIGAGMLAILGIPALIVAGVLIGARGGDDATGHATATTTTTTVGRTAASTDELGEDRLAGLEAGGDVQTMVEQHQGMMDVMRVTATPQMLELMNSDPMWQMMRSGEYVRLLEEHEANIDRMLARGG